MADIHEIVDYCADLLSVETMKDYCPNGLQVEGRKQVQRILLGVTASQELLDYAVEHGFDTVLVHHGYFWKGEPAPLVGMKGRRVATLMRHDINLLAYHLPLDVHPELGNNAQLMQRLGIHDWSACDIGGTPGLLLYADLEEAYTPLDLQQRLFTLLQRKPLLISVSRPIRRLAICSGGAQDMLLDAAALGADAFISGEISERTTYMAREYDVSYFAAGHHATERYGVQALGAHLGTRFAVEVEYLELDNPA